MAVEYIDRPPRIQPELPIAQVEIPQPPDEQARGDQGIISMLLPLVTILGFVLVSGTGNVLFIIPIGLAMVLSVGAAVFTARRGRKQLAEKKRAYERLLAEMRQEMTRSHSVQRIFYTHNYPDVQTLTEIAARKETSRFGTRLWERRPDDSDFGAIRLGMGNRPSTVIYHLSQSNSPLDETPLWKDANKLAEDSAVLTDVPITVPLRPFAKDSEPGGAPEDGDGSPRTSVIARHSIGIFGKNPSNTADTARAALAHFVTFHSALDARLYVIGHPHAQASWQWAEWLPHCNVRGIGEDDISEADGKKKLDQLCFSADKEEVSAFWKRIKRELDQRQLRLRETGEDDKKGGGDITLPLLLVVADLLGPMPANSPIEELASEAVVGMINQEGPALGAAIIFLTNESSKIPSDCQAMVEVASVGEKVVFRYAEVGLNSTRYLGDSDLMTANEARQDIAAKIRRLDVRRSFGADLPRSVDVLQMQSLIESRRIDTVDKLTIEDNWRRSILPQNSEWLSGPIGLVSNKEERNLVFSAKEGGDGVHGMIAGTTGSGKSELLLTLIASLAAKYDPRIVNFVLVDFKGGAAFEPFRKLPHCVDILTNLEANAVERMFVAIQAVMDERSRILARSNAKDLVEYRRKVIPRLGTDDPLPRTFPHLFIIVDEFAEMIAANPDYRTKFESITRLGRAFGVTLILSTQRPAGVVTDQMRANMKFRICLRVETPEDSKELLSRPDAAFLPNMGGRGYIQVGNDILTPIQVARVGGDYSDDRTVVLRDVIWLDEEMVPGQDAGQDAPLYSATEIAEALGLNPGEVPTTMLDWIVGISVIRAQRDGVPVQSKPWPDPLPANLSLTDPIDARYLNTERTLAPDRTTVIHPSLDEWLNNTAEKAIWPSTDWKNPTPLAAEIGLVDNPYRAEQRLLTLDLSAGPAVIFGSAGRGKTTFLKTLLTALATTRSPAELHMFALDFGRAGLKAIKDLPHLGAAIDASEISRVDQLMRMLRNFVNERQDVLAKYNSLADYNAKNPKNIFPEMVVVIDNFAEFKESFEHLIPDLMALIRDGRAFGVNFVITAGTPNDLGGKLYNLLTQRFTFAQADTGIYVDVVGRGAPNFDNVPGRGLIALQLGDDTMPVEFHVGVPGRPDALSDTDEVDGYQVIAQRMDRVWTALGGSRPAAELPRSIGFLEMFSLTEDRPFDRVGQLPIAENWKRSMLPENMEWLRAPIGLISSREVRSLVFSAKSDGDGVHGMVAGTTGSGKSELLLTLIASMAIKYDPRIVNFVLVDFKGGAAFEPFKKLPHCVDIATNLQGNAVERIFIAVKAELDRRAKLLADGRVGDLVDYRRRVIPTLKPGDALPTTFPHLFIIVDEFAEMIAQNPEYKEQFESITRLGRAFGVTLILATQRPAGMVTDQMRANMKFRICLRVETAEDSRELLKRDDAARLPPLGGRGYIQVGSGPLTEVQAAWAGAEYTDNPPDPVYPTEEIMTALGLQAENKPGLMIDWIVGATAAEAKRQSTPVQRKPWPEPLPHVLPLNEPIDAAYIKSARARKAATLVIDPAVEDWIKNEKGEALWKPWDWSAPLPLKAAIGIIDNPFQAEQRVLEFDLTSDPLVVFGSAGRGRTTFLKSLILSLAAKRSPAELHVFGLDFGRGGLKSIATLPHCGATIDASQPDRVEQLFRMILGQMKERQDRLASYASLEDYNAQKLDNPENMFPAILVVIDNFAEFQENYEHMLPDLIGMVRDGRSLGIYYAVTAGNPNEVGGKLYNQLSQRVTFTLPDATAYVDIVGRGALSLVDTPGRGLINIEGQPLEFQTAIPVIAGEKDPYLKIAERMEKAWSAIGGKRPAAELPRSVNVLDMYSMVYGKRVERIGDIPIAENWKRSMQPENQEWLRAPFGLISSREVRDLIFSAKADGDGVHGMIAGTTGSGKSELLLTLIAAMAIRYDPRIVNFVLVDYKGGAAFEPFKKLPHCVDIATNLQGNAVERIFIAMKAELDRRAKLLADGRVGDLVDYRKRVIPRLKEDDPLPKTFPHLFIIVDEFAEMIMANPEYKAQFESITRLGRAFGATLILATQRPAGMVTDQMRANMKFRICLRVETADDSKELLKRPDAATLPPLGGRGYIQVGGGALTEVQAAWAGGEYIPDESEPVYSRAELLEALGLTTDNQPGLMIDWIVGALAAEAKRQEVPKQTKPWPDPLPTHLPMNQPIDATYIGEGRGSKQLVIHPDVARWVDNTEAKPIWAERPADEALSLRTPMGVIDNPYLAEQRLLTIDLGSDPLVVFGAAGRGKTTFLKSLAIGLAATHSPADLHIFALDFGRGGLKALKSLPHIGGIVEVNEEERVERLLRMVRNIIDDRQRKLQAYDSLADYNAANPSDRLPAVLVLIDNASEFRETYDGYLLDLINLIRDGRSFGVYFAVTAPLINDVPTKLFGILSQRITFTQVDPSDYTTLLGRGWSSFNDEPGRGLVIDLVGGRPQPLEFQTAIPIVGDDTDFYRELSERMAKAWETMVAADPGLMLRRAKPVEPLAEAIDLPSVMLPLGVGPAELVVPLGINDLDREPTLIEFKAKGPNWLVVGPPVSGKTTTIRSLVLSLAHSYSPDQVAMVLVDPSDASRQFFNYGGGDGASLRDLPHVLATVSTARQLDTVIKRLRAEFDEGVRAKLKSNKSSYTPVDNRARSIFVIIDHYDDAEVFNRSGLGLGALSEIGKGKNLHFVLAGTLQIMHNSMDDLRRRAESSRYTLVLQDLEAVRYMGVRGDFSVKGDLPLGRGFLVRSVHATLVQMCAPVVDGRDGLSAEDELAAMIAEIRRAYPSLARWSYHAKDLAALEKAIETAVPLDEEEEPPSSAPAPAPASPPVPDTSEAMAELSQLMAMQAQMTEQFRTAEIPDAKTFASLTVDVEAEPKKEKKGSDGTSDKKSRKKKG
jgi:S-DNA-T family DNA segregation ATPase FtsK/SpoIIIE